MRNTYHPMGYDENLCPLTEGEVSYNASASVFLANLVQWFSVKERADMCLRIVEKAESLQDFSSMRVLDRHFYYQNLIQFYYKLRDRDGVLEKVIGLCHDAIAIAPKVARAFKTDEVLNQLPRHVAFEQLAIIEKKRKNWGEVIKICETAKKQKWAGTWDARIFEAKKGLEKQNT